MVDLENLYTKTFWGLISDSSILELLGIEEYSGETFPPSTDEDEALFNVFMEKCVTQIFEGDSPIDPVEDFDTRIGITEGTTSRGSNNKTETGRLIISTFVSKEDNKKTKKTYKLINSVINALDSKKRKDRLLSPLEIGLNGLQYEDRDPYGSTDADGWDLYTIIFKYEFIV